MDSAQPGPGRAITVRRVLTGAALIAVPLVVVVVVLGLGSAYDQGHPIAAVSAQGKADPYPRLLVALPVILAACYLAGLAARRPDIDDIRQLVPRGWDELLAVIDRFVDVGTTKFVVLPIVEPMGPEGWTAELEAAAQILLPRQT